MSDTSTIPAISGTTPVGVPIEKAFRVFTGSFNTWWPREFHIGRGEMAEAILEPHEGGRGYERGGDGSEGDGGGGRQGVRVGSGAGLGAAAPAGRHLADQRRVAVRPRSPPRQRDRGAVHC